MSCIGQSNLKEKRGYKEKGLEDVKKQKYLFFYKKYCCNGGMRKQKSLTRPDDIPETFFFQINKNLLIVLKRIVNMCTFEKTKCLVVRQFSKNNYL